VQQALGERQVHLLLVLKEILVQKDQQDLQVDRLVLVALLVHKVTLVHKVMQVFVAHKVLKVFQVPLQQFQVRKVLKVLKVLKVK
jgi:hypothetical protein